MLNNPPGAQLLVSPSTASVRLYGADTFYSSPPRLPIEQQQFSAAISGQPWPVTWSMDSPLNGKISPTGLYTSPEYLMARAGTQLRIAAVLNADPARSNWAIIKLLGVLWQDRVSLPAGWRTYFWAEVPVMNYTATAGTIDPYGWYTAPVGDYGEVTLQARSAYNSNIVYVSKITIVP